MHKELLNVPLFLPAGLCHERFSDVTSRGSLQNWVQTFSGVYFAHVNKAVGHSELTHGHNSTEISGEDRRPDVRHWYSCRDHMFTAQQHRCLQLSPKVLLTSLSVSFRVHCSDFSSWETLQKVQMLSLRHSASEENIWRFSGVHCMSESSCIRTWGKLDCAFSATHS